MRRDDIPSGLRLCRHANWNQIAADWELFLTSSADACRVAVDDGGRVVGSVATIGYGDAFSWIAMVLVDPLHRRAGIGTRLLLEALTMLGDATTARLDATPEGHGVYVPLGFREEYGLQRMVRAYAPDVGAHIGGVRLRPAPGVRRMTDADFADILEHDRDVFGADRRILLEMCRREAPEYAWVIGEGPIGGYLFGRHGYAFEQLGPLVASHEPAARLLAAACLSAHPDRPFIIDTPLRASWVEWLESAGFSLQRPFTRMCRCERPFQERVDRMFAIAGPEFG